MRTNWQSKIVTLDALTAAAEDARRRSQTVVQCHGCFDIVHPGHVRYLEFARQQGDLLIVSVTGDSDISKGDQRPYIPQELRAENLAALMFVDYVYIDPNPTAEQVLAAVRPDVYVKGREYERSTRPDFLAEKAIVEQYGGRIIFSSGDVVFSSTAIGGGLTSGDNLHAARVRPLLHRHNVTSAWLEHCLDRFRDLHVLVVGDCLLDRYIFCDAFDVASESPMLSLIQRDERTYIGGAGIIARHAAALGAHAFLLGAGGGPYADQIKNTLNEDGIEAQLIDARSDVVEKTRFLAGEDKVLKVDRGQRRPLDSVAEKWAATLLEQQARLADAVIFADFGYGMITAGLLQRVLPTLRHNVPILAAGVSGSRADMLNFHNVDLLCPTERELRTMLSDWESGLSTAAWQLLEKTQARHLIVTLEKRGLVAFERRSQDRRSPEWSARLKSEHVPALATHPVDRLGCGDALLTATTLALAAGTSLMQAGILGAAAAAIEASTLGNQPVSADGIRHWADHHADLMPTPEHGAAATSGPDDAAPLPHATRPPPALCRSSP